MSENNDKKGFGVGDIVNRTIKESIGAGTHPDWKPAVPPVGSQKKEKEKKIPKTYHVSELCAECVRILAFRENSKHSNKVEEYIMKSMPEDVKQEAMKNLGMSDES